MKEGENMLLNEKLRELRDKKRTSQEKVAELVGVSRQAVTKWEKGQTVPISDKLNCTGINLWYFDR